MHGLIRSVFMKRLSPQERKHVLYQTFIRLRKDWTCRYGQWNTNKLLHEFRLLLRKANKPGGLEELLAEDETPVTQEAMPLFEERSA